MIQNNYEMIAECFLACQRQKKLQKTIIISSLETWFFGAYQRAMVLAVSNIEKESVARIHLTSNPRLAVSPPPRVPASLLSA
jgi:hypothetical protein